VNLNGKQVMNCEFNTVLAQLGVGLKKSTFLGIIVYRKSKRNGRVQIKLFIMFKKMVFQKV